MVDNFLKKLIDEFESFDYEKKDYIDYIVTLRQGLQDERYTSFLRELKDTDYKIFFSDKDEYSIKFRVITNESSHHYLLTLSEVMQGIGYCMCEPTDKGYDGRYKCCGYGCDWYRPNFKLEEMRSVGYHSFVGNEHDLWDEIDDYCGVTEEEKQELIKKKQIDEVEEQISILINKLRELKS